MLWEARFFELSREQLELEQSVIDFRRRLPERVRDLLHDLLFEDRVLLFRIERCAKSIEVDALVPLVFQLFHESLPWRVGHPCCLGNPIAGGL